MKLYMREYRARKRRENEAEFLQKQRESTNKGRQKKREKQAQLQPAVVQPTPTVLGVAPKINRRNTIKTTQEAIDALRRELEEANERLKLAKGTPSETILRLDRNRISQKVFRQREKIERERSKEAANTNEDESDEDIISPPPLPLLPKETRQLRSSKKIREPEPASEEEEESSGFTIPRIKNLKAFFSNLTKKNGEMLAASTVKNYVNKFLDVFKKATGKDKSEWDGNCNFLLTPVHVIDTFYSKETNERDTADYWSPVVGILRFYHAPNSILKPYADTLLEQLKRREEKRGNNKMTAKDKREYVPLDTEIQKINDYNIDQYKSKPVEYKKRLTNKLIMSLYFFNTLIARNDYWNMKLVNVRKPLKELNKKFNYLQYDVDRKTVVKIVLFKYKTASKYGTREFAVSGKLKDILNLYLAVMKKHPGDFLFVNQSGQQYQDTNFGVEIKKAAEEVIGKAQTIDTFRSIWRRWFHSQQRTINENKAFSTRMLHNPSVGDTYNRFVDSDEE